MLYLFAQVCREWEGTALKVNKDVRLALIRIGVVLGKDGGALGITDALLSRSLHARYMITIKDIFFSRKIYLLLQLK